MDTMNITACNSNAAGRSVCRVPSPTCIFFDSSHNVPKSTLNSGEESAITEQSGSLASNNSALSLSVDTKTAKGGRKRSRTPRSSPTIFVSTDISNFKAKVRKFTGMPISFPTTEVHAVADSKTPLVVKPMPHRPVYQSSSACLAIPNTSTLPYNSLASVLSKPNTSSPSIRFHSFNQPQNDSFSLPTFFNNELASSGVSSQQETNFYFEELLEELGLNTTSV